MHRHCPMYDSKVRVDDRTTIIITILIIMAKKEKTKSKKKHEKTSISKKWLEAALSLPGRHASFQLEERVRNPL